MHDTGADHWICAADQGFTVSGTVSNAAVTPGSRVTVEVSGLEQGGRVEWCSDSFYSHACALIAPDRPRDRTLRD